MRKLLIITIAVFSLAATGCKAKPELTQVEINLMETILEENQKIHKTLFESDTKIPYIVRLMKLTIDAQEQSVTPELGETLKSIVADLSGINNTDREIFENQYSKVSEKMAMIIKTFNIKKYYEFYCPMEKRTWVSTGLKVENPYASDMRDCGEMVQE